MNTNDGGPAFPAMHSIDGNWVKTPDPQYLGMSLRDYFAAKAMQGILANSQTVVGPRWDHEVSSAYDIADAMLRAREAK